MAFDYNSAKTAGYSDDEITQYLQTKNQQLATGAPESTAPTQDNMVPDNPMENAVNNLGDVAVKGYNFFKPKRIAATVEPMVKGFGQNLAIIPPLAQAFVRGQGATPEQRKEFSQKWNQYLSDIGKTNKIVKDNQNVKNYTGIAGEELTYLIASDPTIRNAIFGGLGGAPLASSAAGQIPGAVTNTAAQNILPWLLSRGAVGAMAGGVHGITDPTQNSIGGALKQGVGEAAVGAPLNVATSALFEAPGAVKNYLANKGHEVGDTLLTRQYNTMSGNNPMNDTAAQRKVNEVVAATKSSLPENQSEELGKTAYDLLGKAKETAKNAGVKTDITELNNAFQDVQNSVKDDPALRAKYNELAQKAFKNISDPNNIEISDLIDTRDQLKQLLDSQGVTRRAVGALGPTEKDSVGLQMKDALDKFITEKLGSANVPGLGETYQAARTLIEGGKAAEKQVGAVSINPSMRGAGKSSLTMPFIKLLSPFLQAGENAVSKGLYNMQPAVAGTQSGVMQALQGILPATLMNQVSGGGDHQGMIHVHKNDSGDTGWIPAGEYDPNVYTKIE